MLRAGLQILCHASVVSLLGVFSVVQNECGVVCPVRWLIAPLSDRNSGNVTCR
jgi:hypothetical protein